MLEVSHNRPESTDSFYVGEVDALDGAGIVGTELPR